MNTQSERVVPEKDKRVVAWAGNAGAGIGKEQIFELQTPACLLNVLGLLSYHFPVM